MGSLLGPYSSRCYALKDLPTRAYAQRYRGSGILGGGHYELLIYTLVRPATVLWYFFRQYSSVTYSSRNRTAETGDRLEISGEHKSPLEFLSLPACCSLGHAVAPHALFPPCPVLVRRFYNKGAETCSTLLLCDTN